MTEEEQVRELFLKWMKPWLKEGVNSEDMLRAHTLLLELRLEVLRTDGKNSDRLRRSLKNG